MTSLKTEKEMFPLVEGWLASGLTQKQFCANHRLPVHVLAYWVGKYRKCQFKAENQVSQTKTNQAVSTKSKPAKKVMATDSTSGFIRLSPPPQLPTLPTTQLPAATMEVVLPTGAVIRFSSTMPISYLTELLSLCSH